MDRLFVNLYAPDLVRVWLHLDPSNNLEITELNSERVTEIGEEPEWLHQEKSDVGWDHLLDVAWTHSSMDEDGNDWNESNARWALHRGIAPGQPFLVELLKPRYYRCGMYDEETDVEYYHSIVRIKEWPVDRIAAAWQRWRDQEVVHRFAERDQRRMRKTISRMDVGSMYVWIENRGEHSEKVVAILMSDAHRIHGYGGGGVQLAYGEHGPTLTSDYGNVDGAIDALISDAAKKLPGLPAERIRSMPRKRHAW